VDGPDDRARPRGRDEVTGAILDAAVELFARRDPSSVSLREVAARAHVNHGLVHHYFGSKEALVGEVLRRRSREQAAVIADGTDLAEAVAALHGTEGAATYVQLLAHAVVAGSDPAAVGRGGLVARRLVELIEQERADDPVDDAEVRQLVALVLSLVTGWELFGPYFSDLLELDEAGVAAVDARMGTVARLIVGGDGAEQTP
jgi:AcrR family transcriptional regulator